MNNLNPFELFGFKNVKDITLSKLKKKYYEFSLLCHPDKGGTQEDILIVYNSYLYIKKQLENKNNYLLNCKFINDTINFEDYMKKYKQEPPPFYKIWLESEDYEKHKLFNKNFERIHKINSNNTFIQNGYGDLMDKTDKYNNNELDDLYKLVLKKLKLPKNVNKIILLYINKSVNTFYNNNINKELILYSKFEDYGCNERIDNKKCNDYSSKLNNIDMSDYKLAYSVNNNNNYVIKNRTLEELIKERESLFNHN